MFQIISQASYFGDKIQNLRGESPETPNRKEENMSKRNIEIKIRLNRKEMDLLNKKVKQSGMSRESYLRHLINGVVPQDMPPPDYHHMMEQLHGIGRNLNQIAIKAHTLNVIDVQRYDQAYAEFEKAVKQIIEAVRLPRSIGK